MYGYAEHNEASPEAILSMKKDKKRPACQFPISDSAGRRPDEGGGHDVGIPDGDDGVATDFANCIIWAAAQRELPDAQLLQAALLVVTRLIQQQSVEVRH